MHLEDFPMDVHACPLKFGSCKFIFKLRFLHFKATLKKYFATGQTSRF